MDMHLAGLITEVASWDSGIQRIDGDWLVTHEHTSVPFKMDGSLQAAVDLEP